jgi:hypothetical protein
MVMRTGSARPARYLLLMQQPGGRDLPYIHIIERSALTRLWGGRHNRVAQPRALAAPSPYCRPSKAPRGHLHSTTRRDAAVGEGPCRGPRGACARGNQ